MSCCSSVTVDPTLVEDQGQRFERLEQARILAASTRLDATRYKTDFIVPDMHCAACIKTIERELNQLEVCEQARANLTLKTVSIVWNAETGSITGVPRRLSELGFRNHIADNPLDDTKTNKTASSLLLALAVAGFAAANIMLLSVSVWSGADAETTKLFHLISGLIAVPAVAFSGRPFFRSALNALLAKRLNMDVPISLAVLLALLMSVYESITGGSEAYFDASVTLLFFLLIGRYLDQQMRNRARGAVERLSSLSLKDAVLVSGKSEPTHIDIKLVKPGMLLRVYAGERFPVNGLIAKGETDLDRSHVTGESESVFAETGSAVEAGTLNLSSTVDIKATSSANNSFLAEMRRMIEVAEQGRGNYTRIADRMAAIYAPAVHLLAFIAFAAWMVITNGDWHQSIYTAIAVLIVTCPCALGLAVPVAHVIGANKLMQNGILMRDGTALERLAEIGHVIFDKTGTLTHGLPNITAAHNLTNDSAPIIKALASHSAHPNAHAINAWLDCKPATGITALAEHPGYGIEAKHKGKKIRLGKPEWVAEIASAAPKVETTSSAFTIEGGALSSFEIGDALREDAAEAISTLNESNIPVEILSGDRPTKVADLAGRLGIHDFMANQTPADKITHINMLSANGHKPLMVGDGINDAPALAASHVSMVPASASDIGRQAADFVFIRKSMLAVPLAHRIAKSTDRIVRQNFGLAIAYNCIAIPLAMAGFVTPLLAAIAMSASSILVVANSFRISLDNPLSTIASRLKPSRITTAAPTEKAYP